MDEVMSSPSEAMQDAVSTTLAFVVDAEKGELQVVYTPQLPTLGIDRPTFNASLAAAGYAHFHLDLDAIDFFLAETKVLAEPYTTAIGVRRDAEFWLIVPDDFMSARLTLLPSQGGEGIGTRVQDAMREKGIMHGILHETLDAVLAAGFCDDVVIARGTPAREGVPAQFDSMLLDQQKQLELVDENAVIKYRDLGHLLLVAPGNRLMRRTAPVQGTNGIDVFGDTVFPRALPEMEFGDGFAGATPDPSNPNVLLASIAGQPVVVENGVIVNPVIEVDNVDLSTGNITFDGTVHVNGDVKAGMFVKVSGDVIIAGTLEAAEISAGGNVAVAGGIIGRADSRPGSTVLPADTVRIKCKGSVQALFVENAHIEAGDSILVARSVRQCELIALNEIIVGTGGSKISQIIGGLTQAKKRVRVSVLGSTAGVKTRVQVGFDPYVNGELVTATKSLAQKNEELERVLQLTVFFRQNPKKGEGGLAEKVNASREKLLNDIYELTTKLEELKSNVGVDEDARVQVDKGLYFGTEVRIGNQVWQVLDDTKGTVIGLSDGRIATGMAMPRPKTETVLTLTKAPQNLG